ncbi:MAG: DUF4114 domain-containing protein [Desulfobacterales bacterium]|nr:DUF4114 domain-containing protein [Desulfobacterales bacterium]
MKKSFIGSLTVLFALMFTMSAWAVDYYNYSSFNPGIGYVTSCGGYVDTNGYIEEIPGAEYIFVVSGTNGGHYHAYIYRVETDGDPNMHPDNPDTPGPVAQRNFIQVGEPYYLGYFKNSCPGHTNDFQVNDSGIYYGPTAPNPWEGGIYHWDFGWKNKTKVAPLPPRITQTLAYDEATGNWWAGDAQRRIYMYDGVSWTYQGTHRNLGGSHHDGMEIVNGKLFISDMTSDIIIMHELDGDINWQGPDKTFTYKNPAYVEGMGYGPNGHLWISGSKSRTFYELGGGNLQKVLSSAIPGQCVVTGQPFTTFDADDYIATGESYTWTVSGNTDLTVNIDPENFITITYPEGWKGTEILTFTVTNEHGITNRNNAIFRVCETPTAPKILNIPAQTSPFAPFDLDNFFDPECGLNSSDIKWSFNAPAGWAVEIDENNIITILEPKDSGEPAAITLTATSKLCKCAESSASTDMVVIPLAVPELIVTNPEKLYLQSDFYTCDEKIAVTGTVTDSNGIKSLVVNGTSVTLTPTDNPDKPGEFSFNLDVPLDLEGNTVEVTAVNSFEKFTSISRTVYRFESGVFIVGDDGIVKTDWLFDGGDYQGQVGIFSLSDMDLLVPNSVEFIKEAAARALSDSELGYIIISDKTEGARFSGYLGETEDHNSGPYKGVKSFSMKPGDRFAFILVPNYTLQDLYNEPATANIQKRPLFSLASANPNHEMYVGQTAAINDQDNAFIYEDKNFVESDRDFNDFIFQVKGVIVCEGKAPTLDKLKADGTFKKDWRKTTVLGTQVIEHIESPSVQDDTMWISVAFQGLADFFIYDPDGRVIGKEGGYIPGATFETDQDGNQIISLPALESGDYRLVMRSTGSAEATLKVRGYKGEAELVTADVTFPMKPHQTFSSVLEAANFIVDTVIDIQTPKIPEGPDGKPLLYDFDADGDIDVGDIMKIASRWESQEGDDAYDSFFDFNDDGRITLSDIIKVVNSRND